MSGQKPDSPTLAHTDVAEDVVQRFLEQNKQDEELVEPYKGYAKYEKLANRWAGPVLLIVFVGIFPVAVIESWVYGPEQNQLIDAYVWFAAAVMVSVMVVNGGAVIAQRLSDVTSEQVVYHELASAFELYRANRDNLEPIFHRISTAVSFLERGQFQRIDRKRKQAVERYLTTLVEAEKPSYVSDKLHDTFPEFMEEFAKAVVQPNETTFSRIASKMDSAYLGEPRIRKRIIKDTRRLIEYLFTGAESVLVAILVILGVSYYHFGLELGIAVGIAGVLIGVYSVYQSRD